MLRQRVAAISTVPLTSNSSRCQSKTKGLRSFFRGLHAAAVPRHLGRSRKLQTVQPIISPASSIAFSPCYSPITRRSVTTDASNSSDVRNSPIVSSLDSVEPNLNAENLHLPPHEIDALARSTTQTINSFAPVAIKARLERQFIQDALTVELGDPIIVYSASAPPIDAAGDANRPSAQLMLGSVTRFLPALRSELVPHLSSIYRVPQSARVEGATGGICDAETSGPLPEWTLRLVNSHPGLADLEAVLLDLRVAYAMLHPDRLCPSKRIPWSDATHVPQVEMMPSPARVDPMFAMSSTVDSSLPDVEFVTPPVPRYYVPFALEALAEAGISESSHPEFIHSLRAEARGMAYTLGLILNRRIIGSNASLEKAVREAVVSGPGEPSSAQDAIGIEALPQVAAYLTQAKRIFSENKLLKVHYSAPGEVGEVRSAVRPVVVEKLKAAGTQEVEGVREGLTSFGKNIKHCEPLAGPLLASYLGDSQAAFESASVNAASAVEGLQSSLNGLLEQVKKQYGSEVPKVASDMQEESFITTKTPAGPLMKSLKSLAKTEIPSTSSSKTRKRRKSSHSFDAQASDSTAVLSYPPMSWAELPRTLGLPNTVADALIPKEVASYVESQLTSKCPSAQFLGKYNQFLHQAIVSIHARPSNISVLHRRPGEGTGLGPVAAFTRPLQRLLREFRKVAGTPDKTQALYELSKDIADLAAGKTSVGEAVANDATSASESVSSTASSNLTEVAAPQASFGGVWTKAELLDPFSPGRALLDRFMNLLPPGNQPALYRPATLVLGYLRPAHVQSEMGDLLGSRIEEDVKRAAATEKWKKREMEDSLVRDVEEIATATNSTSSSQSPITSTTPPSRSAPTATFAQSAMAAQEALSTPLSVQEITRRMQNVPTPKSVSASQAMDEQLSQILGPLEELQPLPPHAEAMVDALRPDPRARVFGFALRLALLLPPPRLAALRVELDTLARIAVSEQEREAEARATKRKTIPGGSVRAAYLAKAKEDAPGSGDSPYSTEYPPGRIRTAGSPWVPTPGARRKGWYTSILRASTLFHPISYMLDKPFVNLVASGWLTPPLLDLAYATCYADVRDQNEVPLAPPSHPLASSANLPDASSELAATTQAVDSEATSTLDQLVTSAIDNVAGESVGGKGDATAPLSPQESIAAILQTQCLLRLRSILRSQQESISGELSALHTTFENPPPVALTPLDNIIRVDPRERGVIHEHQHALARLSDRKSARKHPYARSNIRSIQPIVPDADVPLLSVPVRLQVSRTPKYIDYMTWRSLELLKRGEVVDEDLRELALLGNSKYRSTFPTQAPYLTSETSHNEIGDDSIPSEEAEAMDAPSSSSSLSASFQDSSFADDVRFEQFKKRGPLPSWESRTSLDVISRKVFISSLPMIGTRPPEWFLKQPKGTEGSNIGIPSYIDEGDPRPEFKGGETATLLRSSVLSLSQGNVITPDLVAQYCSHLGEVESVDLLWDRAMDYESAFWEREKEQFAKWAWTQRQKRIRSEAKSKGIKVTKQDLAPPVASKSESVLETLLPKTTTNEYNNASDGDTTGGGTHTLSTASSRAENDMHLSDEEDFLLDDFDDDGSEMFSFQDSASMLPTDDEYLEETVPMSPSLASTPSSVSSASSGSAFPSHLTSSSASPLRPALGTRAMSIWIRPETSLMLPPMIRSALMLPPGWIYTPQRSMSAATATAPTAASATSSGAGSKVGTSSKSKETKSRKSKNLDTEQLKTVDSALKELVSERFADSAATAARMKERVKRFNLTSELHAFVTFKNREGAMNASKETLRTFGLVIADQACRTSPALDCRMLIIRHLPDDITHEAVALLLNVQLESIGLKTHLDPRYLSRRRLKEVEGGSNHPQHAVTNSAGEVLIEFASHADAMRAYHHLRNLSISIPGASTVTRVSQPPGRRKAGSGASDTPVYTFTDGPAPPLVVGWATDEETRRKARV